MAYLFTDAGHGGSKNGAVWHDTREKDLNLLYTQDLNSTLKERGHSVYTSRISDIRVPSLGVRCRLVNEHHNQQAPAFDAIVSIHCNVSVVEDNGVYKAIASRRGMYVIYSAESESAKSLAASISAKCAAVGVTLNHKGMLSTLELGRTLAWIHKTTPPAAVLVELGFMTNPQELEELKSVEYRKKMVKCIADGIDNYVSS